MSCPICEKRYYDIENSESVCDRHQNWVVTRCYACHKICFSECDSVCPYCGTGFIRVGRGGNKEHRGALRGYGLEGWD